MLEMLSEYARHHTFCCIQWSKCLACKHAHVHSPDSVHEAGIGHCGGWPLKHRKNAMVFKQKCQSVEAEWDCQNKIHAVLHGRTIEDGLASCDKWQESWDDRIPCIWRLDPGMTTMKPFLLMDLKMKEEVVVQFIPMQRLTHASFQMGQLYSLLN